MKIKDHIANWNQQSGAKHWVRGGKPICRRSRWFAFAGLCTLLLLGMLAGRSGLGQSNLTLKAWLSNSTIQITISNGLPSGHYDLFWVPELPTGNIPWSLCQTGAVGQTNFSVPFGPFFSGFFVVATNDIDFDSWPNYEDGNSTNSSIHALSIYIESPTNGAVIY